MVGKQQVQQLLLQHRLTAADKIRAEREAELHQLELARQKVILERERLELERVQKEAQAQREAEERPQRIKRERQAIDQELNTIGAQQTALSNALGAKRKELTVRRREVATSGQANAEYAHFEAEINRQYSSLISRQEQLRAKLQELESL